MDAMIHCRACRAPLRIPRNAANHRARCPSCGHQFIIPPEHELIEETISFWIEQDTDEIFEGDDQPVDVETPQQQADDTQRTQSAPAQQTSAQTQAESTSEHSDAPTAAPSPPTTQTAGAESAAPQTSEPPAASPEPVAASTSASQAEASTTITSPAGESTRASQEDENLPDEYPQDLFVRTTVPHLVVRRCDDVGVCFAFDSSWLRHEGFRASMPVRCVFSGHTDRSRLIARPLVFQDRSELKRPPAVDQLAREHEDHVLGDRSTRQRMRMMGELEHMPVPFNLVMPYYVSTSYAHLFLHCEAHDRSDGVTCEVLIPDALCALDWLARVNGVCGVEYRMLERETSMLHGEQWQKLPEQVRQRINAWCKIRPREVLQLYLNDADFGRRDAGLAGLVVTDQRVVFNKYHHRGEIALDAEDALILAQCDEQFAHLSLAVGSSRSRMINLHRKDVSTLVETIRRVGSLRVVMCK